MGLSLSLSLSLRQESNGNKRLREEYRQKVCFFFFRSSPLTGDSRRSCRLRLCPALRLLTKNNSPCPPTTESCTPVLLLFYLKRAEFTSTNCIAWREMVVAGKREWKTRDSSIFRRHGMGEESKAKARERETTSVTQNVRSFSPHARQKKKKEAKQRGMSKGRRRSNVMPQECHELYSVSSRRIIKRERETRRRPDDRNHPNHLISQHHECITII